MAISPDAVFLENRGLVRADGGDFLKKRRRRPGGRRRASCVVESGEDFLPLGGGKQGQLPHGGGRGRDHAFQQNLIVLHPARHGGWVEKLVPVDAEQAEPFVGLEGKQAQIKAEPAFGIELEFAMQPSTQIEGAGGGFQSEGGPDKA